MGLMVFQNNDKTILSFLSACTFLVNALILELLLSSYATRWSVVVPVIYVIIFFLLFHTQIRIISAI
jgi:hypothetical protein